MYVNSTSTFMRVDTGDYKHNITPLSRNQTVSFPFQELSRTQLTKTKIVVTLLSTENVVLVSISTIKCPGSFPSRRN